MKKWECTICGYIHEGDEPPDECPICSADKSAFVEVTEQEQPTQEQTVVEEPVSSAVPAQEPTQLQKIYSFASEQIVKHHLHPIAVHTPNGVLPMAFLFLLITLFFGLPLFETAAFYSFIFVLIVMPFVIFTGYEIWKNRYRGL